MINTETRKFGTDQAFPRRCCGLEWVAGRCFRPPSPSQCQSASRRSLCGFLPPPIPRSNLCLRHRLRVEDALEALAVLKEDSTHSTEATRAGAMVAGASVK